MDDRYYIIRLEEALQKQGKNNDYIDVCCQYARFLMDNDLPVLFDANHVRIVLKLDEINEKAYHCFKAGNEYKPRFIEAPSVSLKKRQKWILENILEKEKLLPCIHGFVKGKSIVSNAKCHVGKRYLLCMDIKSFFRTISITKVKQLFLSMGYSIKAAEELAKICTFDESAYFFNVNNDEDDVVESKERYLPQGAPSSPMIANLVFQHIDQLILDLVKEKDITYTRYADDLCFSSDVDSLKELGTYIEQILRNNQFQINNHKTRLMGMDTPKIFMGLNITSTIKIRSEYKRELRKEIYFCKKYGIESHLDKTKKNGRSNFIQYLYGKAYYVSMIEPSVGRGILEELDEIFSNEHNYNL